MDLEGSHLTTLNSIRRSINSEVSAFADWREAAVSLQQVPPSHAVVDEAMKLYEAAETLIASVLSASTAAAGISPSDCEWLIDRQPSLGHSTAQSSEALQTQVRAPRVLALRQLLEADAGEAGVTPLTKEEASDNASWVTEGKNTAASEFLRAERHLEALGADAMAAKIQHTRLRLWAAKSAQEAADVYKGEWREAVSLTRSKAIDHCILDVVVRLSRRELGFVNRGAFDVHMEQLFGTEMQGDKHLKSRLHQAMQKSMLKLPSTQAFVSKSSHRVAPRQRLARWFWKQVEPNV
jgi:hypothetical protein